MDLVSLLVDATMLAIVIFLARMTYRAVFPDIPPESRVRTLRVGGFVVIDLRRAGAAAMTLPRMAKVASLHGWGEPANGYVWLVDAPQGLALRSMSARDRALMGKRMLKVGPSTLVTLGDGLAEAAADFTETGVTVVDALPVIEVDGSAVDILDALERRDA